MDESSYAFEADPSRPSATAPFKGIALFTPGGDCVYAIDTEKRAHWHIDLCAVLQQQLQLLHPPYFLLPCFTATIDCWLDADSQTLLTLAEAYPRVMRYQPLLNALFQVEGIHWQANYSDAETCSTAVINSFRSQFPTLWEAHDLIIQAPGPQAAASPPSSPQPREGQAHLSWEPYVFKLFVHELHTVTAEHMLRVLRRVLESALPHPYTLQVVDVALHPELAEANHISATPTLMRVSPQPTRRLVGNLLDQQALMDLLIHS